MKIVHMKQVAVDDVPGKARVGTWKRGVIMRGDPDSLGDFRLSILYENGSKSTPRHRHNFDQYRYQLEGEVDFARDGKLNPGFLGYFPEGAYYGPTSAPNPNAFISVQFGGPSGSGYLTTAEHEAAHKALQTLGVFENGFFHRHPGVEGKKIQDGFEAAWEYAKQRSIVYPNPQHAPTIMDTNEGPWMPLDSVPGVSERTLGSFTNCNIRMARYKLESAASFVATGRGIYLVLSGTGSVEADTFQKLSTVYLDDDEKATFNADDATEVLLMGMPSVALMANQPAKSAALQSGK